MAGIEIRYYPVNVGLLYMEVLNSCSVIVINTSKKASWFSIAISSMYIYMFTITGDNGDHIAKPSSLY